MTNSKKVTVRFLAPLSQYTDNQKTIECEGDDVKQVIEAIAKKYPKLGEQLFDTSSNSIRDFINIFRNGEDIRNTGGILSRLAENDRIIIMSAIAGG